MCKCESIILVLDMANDVVVVDEVNCLLVVKNADRAAFGIDDKMMEDRMMLCIILNDISKGRDLSEDFFFVVN